MPISLSYRRGQPGPQLTHIPSCISREVRVRGSLGWETESVSQLCSLSGGGQESLQGPHPAEEGTEIPPLGEPEEAMGVSLGIDVQTDAIPEGFREKVVHRPSLLRGGTDQRKI